MNYNHPRNILVATLQRLYDNGMTTTSGGNLSIKDEDGNIWITPSGIDKGSLKPSDIIKVYPDGKMEGPHKPSCELPFHRAVYKLRPDARAVLHAHSPALVAFSLVGKMPDPTLIPGCSEICGKVAFEKYDIPGSESLGKLIAAEFVKGADSVIMENHGAVVCGKTIAECFSRFETLDFVARMQINAASHKNKIKKAKGKLPAPIAESFVPKFASPKECELREAIAGFIARSYRQGLLFSGNAFMAARIDGDDFVITPLGLDPQAPTAAELVRVCKGKAEKGKTAALAAPMCREIFKKHKNINAVFMTRPPCLCSFDLTGTPMDSRTIPESYIQLRDMPLLTSAEYFKSADAAAKRITPTTPVLMVENYGVMTTGKTLIESFDRLEVAEFTAKCLLLAGRIGTYHPINQKQVEDIIDAFGLPR